MGTRGYPNGSAMAGGTNASKDTSIRGLLYPNKLTYTLSGLKILTGCGMVVLGALALYHKASYARTAVGLWAGIVVIVSGVLGAFSVRTGASRPYVLSFFASCGASLVVTVLVIIYAATGLARDSGFPGGFIRDSDSGELVPVSQINLPTREGAMIVNLLLIILGVLDILFTLPSFIICLREVCQCYPPSAIARAEQRSAGSYAEGTGSGVGAAGTNDWLMSWLGQQTGQVFFSNASGMPFAAAPGPASGPVKMAAYHGMVNRGTPPFVLLPSSEQSQLTMPPTAQAGPMSPRRHQQQHQHQQRPSSQKQRKQPGRPRSKSPNGKRHKHPRGHPHQHQAPLEIYAPAAQFYHPYVVPQSYPSPGSNLSHPSMAQLIPYGAHPPPHPWLYATPEEAYAYGAAYYGEDPHYGRWRQRSQSASRRKRPRSKSGGRSEVSANPAGQPIPVAPERKTGKKKRPKGPTDSDLDKTYTGLDRELAEEFIEQTMDPNIVLERTMSGNESEAW